ncbi:putative ammonia monooxygenase [Streptomyces acidiscabies]|nr:putative ammonia monooxygenase [Streptomyces acidiscabies]
MDGEPVPDGETVTVAHHRQHPARRITQPQDRTVVGGEIPDAVAAPRLPVHVDTVEQLPQNVRQSVRMTQRLTDRAEQTHPFTLPHVTQSTEKNAYRSVRSVIPPHTLTPPYLRTRRCATWTAVVLSAAAAGEAAEPFLPAPHLLAPLLTGLAVAVAGFSAGKLPLRVNRWIQAALGVLMGSYLGPHALQQTSGRAAVLALVTAATALLSLAGGAVLARVGRVDHASALLGMVAGGSAAVVCAAEELDADPRTVAFLQYLRVALVAATAPVIAQWFCTAPTGQDAARSEQWLLVNGPHQTAGLLLLAATAATGTWLGTRVRLPSPALLGPMLLTAALTVSGTATGFTPSGLLRAALFTAVGLDIGLRFTRPAVVRMRRLLPLALTLTLTICAVCAALAWLIAVTTRIPPTDAYLATTPGGINAVLATAVATRANVPLISGVQSLRLFAMVLIAPPLIRWVERYRPPRTHKG